MSTYFWILAGSVIFPLLLSFDKKVSFYKCWKYFFPANILVSVLFIAWDILFTHLEVWGFNERHLSGLYLFNIPLEEALFFIVIPYCATFTYEVIKAYFQNDFLSRYSRKITIILLMLLMPVGFLFIHRLYTSVNLILASFLLFLFQFILKSPYMGRFYSTFFIIQIPFLIVNGLLTGIFIPEEVVWYNPTQLLGIRIGTIPVEDTFFGLNLILLNIAVYEFLKTKLKPVQ